MQAHNNAGPATRSAPTPASTGSQGMVTFGRLLEQQTASGKDRETGAISLESQVLPCQMLHSHTGQVPHD